MCHQPLRWSPNVGADIRADALYPNKSDYIHSVKRHRWLPFRARLCRTPHPPTRRQQFLAVRAEADNLTQIANSPSGIEPNDKQKRPYDASDPRQYRSMP